MGRSQRAKGVNGERELVKWFIERGVPAWRDWQNGPGHQGDLLANIAGATKIVEVKRRGQGFKQIEAWLEGADLLCYRRDRGDWIVTLRLADLVDLVRQRREREGESDGGEPEAAGSADRGRPRNRGL